AIMPLYVELVRSSQLFGGVLTTFVFVPNEIAPQYGPVHMPSGSFIPTGTVSQVAGLYGARCPCCAARIPNVGETSKVSGSRDCPLRLLIAWISSAELSSSPSLFTLIPYFCENLSRSGPSLAQSGGSPTTFRCPSFCAFLIRPARPSEPSEVGSPADDLDPLPPQAARKLAIEPAATRPAAPRPPRTKSSRLVTSAKNALSMSYMTLPPHALGCLTSWPSEPRGYRTARLEVKMFGRLLSLVWRPHCQTTRRARAAAACCGRKPSASSSPNGSSPISSQSARAFRRSRSSPRSSACRARRCAMRCGRWRRKGWYDASKARGHTWRTLASPTAWT